MWYLTHGNGRNTNANDLEFQMACLVGKKPYNLPKPVPDLHEQFVQAGLLVPEGHSEQLHGKNYRRNKKKREKAKAKAAAAAAEN